MSRPKLADGRPTPSQSIIYAQRLTLTTRLNAWVAHCKMRWRKYPRTHQLLLRW